MPTQPPRAGTTSADASASAAQGSRAAAATAGKVAAAKTTAAAAMIEEMDPPAGDEYDELAGDPAWADVQPLYLVHICSISQN